MTWKLDRKYKNGGPVPENYLGGLAPPVTGMMKLTEVGESWEGKKHIRGCGKHDQDRKESYNGIYSKYQYI